MDSFGHYKYKGNLRYFDNTGLQTNISFHLKHYWSAVAIGRIATISFISLIKMNIAYKILCRIYMYIYIYIVIICIIFNR